ncbi:uncharacterized protein LOC115551390 isoform X2 [Gadus morhua]|uniref:uncharacterized protein LOC115551390 isoform X2 n=1 Tax=Gadus morhua TaxID=8049 RepID=UPI0011B68E8C|nr:uncharacterized protein LOC115551390 isoform X2 [Gadus morhua]
MCGETHWSAARETSRQSSKLDEEGVEVAVCRHGFLLKGLNMYRGEIFADPMFLQKDLQSAKFLAMDVTCRYVPYINKVSEALTHLKPLQEMRHCLSVMHAKAHNTKCEILWSARNQEGVGTILGEEVEQVNSYLSRCALTTKYMAKSVRIDMLTVHAMGWNQRKEDGLHIALSSRFKKTWEVSENLKNLQDQMHCWDGMLKQWVADVKQWASSDRNKRRQKITQKIAQEKKRLLEEIVWYNQKPDVDLVDTSSVVQNLSSKADERMIWPWQEQNKDGVDILTKKKLFDLHMLASRLAEENEILVKEMMQHCYPNGFTEKGSKGLICVLQRRLKDLKLKQRTVAGAYRGILEPGVRLVEEEDGELEEDMDSQSDDSSEDEDDGEEV